MFMEGQGEIVRVIVELSQVNGVLKMTPHEVTVLMYHIKKDLILNNGVYTRKFPENERRYKIGTTIYTVRYNF